MKSAKNRLRHDPSTLTCSTCGQQFLLDETETPPFCSERCKLIDLGRWMDEEVGLPHEGGPANAEGFEPNEHEHEHD
ncbi:MAG: DNA gyrase inhibitor YacG [Rubripirellula sp.]|nr:DNA gyrase inhibitor YacG [Rubripirellula sp.]